MRRFRGSGGKALSKTSCFVIFALISLVVSSLPVKAETVIGPLLQSTGNGSSRVLLMMTGSKVRRLTVTPTASVSRFANGSTPKPAKLSDLQPGDQVTVSVDAAGKVKSVSAKYSLTQGRLKTVLKRSLLLEDGRLIEVNPNAKVVTENGTSVSYSILHRGDYVALKLNPATGDAWKITLSDESQPLSISSISHDAPGSLKTGDTFTVTMEGTPGCKATFSVIGAVSYVKMAELTPGRYVGALSVTSTTPRIKSAAVIGRLSRGGKTVGPIQASTLVSIENVKKTPIETGGHASPKPVPKTPAKPAGHTQDHSSITILRPVQGSKIHNPLIVIGKAIPRDTLKLTVTYSNEMAGLLRLEGTLISGTLKADDEGSFRSGPIELPQVYAGKGLVITVKVETAGENSALKPVLVKVRGD